ncbi:glycoside hydrolase family 3 N-terminal domain-containing protein [Streptomyces sp. NPDC055952]|uniref:beta-xylosidase/alpha-l-arabinosidase n=1 Tax=Streptomyces sp. NPDC055952 TaxID=3345663 RepID=UPI0035DEBDB5
MTAERPRPTARERANARTLPAWRDPDLDDADRVTRLLAEMTLEEKIAQLYGVWVGAEVDGSGVAPHQHEMAGDEDIEALTAHGLGQLTRSFGTRPVDPALGALALARAQQRLVSGTRLGIPAVAHEECLAGFTAHGATVYPVPLSWGATFDPALVREAATAIGTDLRSVGVHQGLAPVLDVARDLRWGRVEETIGEDPYLVGTVGAAYVRGLQSAGVIATLKHFAGYSASQGGRNLAPVQVGPRELADVLLPPFEMAVRDAGARSVMHAYTTLDGVPSAADPRLLTDLLRGDWQFDGTVVADYFGVAFLERLHRVAGSLGHAAHLALNAGVDVELPTGHCYAHPLLTAVEKGQVPESLVDRAVTRVLLQKCSLGLLDGDYDPLPERLAALLNAGDEELDSPTAPDAVEGGVDLDSAGNRALARRLAEQAVILLANSPAADGRPTLPVTGIGSIAVLGPLADDQAALLGCYSFPAHVGQQHPDVPTGVPLPTVLQAVRQEFPAGTVRWEQGCPMPEHTGHEGADDDGGERRARSSRALEAAAALAADSDLCVVVVGDKAGLFGRGTSGEGCDAPDLSLPGDQAALLDAALGTGTPVVLVVTSGRPYALGRWADRLSAVVQAFFPGEEGAGAIAGVLSGRINPSGRLPVSVPRLPGGQPWTYLQPPLGLSNDTSSLDPTPLFPFGHGLSYTGFAWEDPRCSEQVITTDGRVSAEVTIRNTGPRSGTEVVQLYLHDPLATVSQPVRRLIGYARVDLAPGQARRVVFDIHADVFSYTDGTGTRVVEPGDVELHLGASSSLIHHRLPLRVRGALRAVGHDRVMTCNALVH